MVTDIRNLNRRALATTAEIAGAGWAPELGRLLAVLGRSPDWPSWARRPDRAVLRAAR